MPNLWPNKKDVHVLSDFIGGDSRVNLCSLDVCVAEHFADRLDGNTSSQCHGCCEGVAGEVEGQVLFDATDVG